MNYSNQVRSISRDSALSISVLNNDVERLEDAFEHLLRAIHKTRGVTVNEDREDRRKVDLELCLGDHLFHISIIQYIHTTEITPPPLSPRELEIARLIAKGMQNKEIAYKLGLSPCTVSTYTKRIYLKLDVNSRVEMVAKVLNDFASFF